MKISPLVLQTFGRLSALRSFIDLIDNALPESAWTENEALKRKAEEDEWDWGDFSVERDALEERFVFWLPRYTAYSAVVLLHTIVEVQLTSCAKLVEKDSPFKLNELRGTGFELAALFLDRVGVFHAKTDPAWQSLCDVKDLRHLVVVRIPRIVISCSGAS